MDDRVITTALELARVKEEKEQRIIKEIYILNENIYFSRSDLKGNEPDFTLVRHVDETSTLKEYKDRNGF